MLIWFLDDPRRSQSEHVYQDMKQAGVATETTRGLSVPVGWAENAARRCVLLEPKANLAIIEIEDPT